jgi:hypothetical protein
MRRVLLLSLFLFFCGQTAHSCSCAGNNAVCSVYWDTQLLVRGRVTSIQLIPGESQQVVVDGKAETAFGPGTLEVHVTVLERLRGDVGAEVVIRTPYQSSACGVPFQEGAEYLIYGYERVQGEWWTNKCMRTHEIVSADQDPDLQWIHALATAKPGGTIFGRASLSSPDFENNGFTYQPLAGVTVHIKGPADRSVKTDNEGDYRIAGLPIGTYEVTPEYPNGLGPATPSTVSLREKGCAEVPFTAQSDGAVDGNLFLSDMTPASGVYMRLKRIDEGNSPNWTQDLYLATTDAAGHFHFEPVQPGAYVLGVNTDFPPQNSPYQHKNFYPGKSRQEQAEVLHVVGAQRIEGLRYVLPPEPVRKDIPVRVKIVMPSGAPAPNASVELWNPQWPESNWGPQAKIDEDGWHVLDLPEGELYNLFSRADTPDGYLCAGPKALVASASMQPIVLVLDGTAGTCFDKHITEIPHQ